MAVAPIRQSVEEHAMGRNALWSVYILSLSSFSRGDSFAVRCVSVASGGACPVNSRMMSCARRRVAPGMICSPAQWLYLDPNGPAAERLGVL